MVDEFGSFMFEINASKPYNTLENFQQTIREIRRKYYYLQSNQQIIPLTIPNIPFLGSYPPQSSIIRNPESTQKKVFQSIYLQDACISSHLRYQTLNKNICLRRNQRISHLVPLWIDQRTNFCEIEQKTKEPFQNSIHMDSVCFGLGVSSLQCTFSTKNLDHARYIHDQLNILSPIFLTLTAGTPFHKGMISEWDVRWPVAQGTVDDRTVQQRDPCSQSQIPDSRYSSANYYIWNGDFNLQSYNDYDLNLKQCEKQVIKQQCQQLGIQIDDMLLKYLTNIMKRDHLIVKESFKTSSQNDNEVFQMLNGTIWSSVRLKIPINDSIGWRVEFRTMDVQLTPDQNAAYILIIHFIIRILHENYDLNLYLPVSKLRQNFEKAFKKDALRKQKFNFRINVFDKGQPQIQQLSVEEIFFGKSPFDTEKSDFKGLFYIMIEQMENTFKVKTHEKCRFFVQSIENFLRKKTCGELLTLAQWMRKYVAQNKSYKKDSMLSKQLIDDMLTELFKISKGTKQDSNFLSIFGDKI